MVEVDEPAEEEMDAMAAQQLAAAGAELSPISAQEEVEGEELLAEGDELGAEEDIDPGAEPSEESERDAG